MEEDLMVSNGDSSLILGNMMCWRSANNDLISNPTIDQKNMTNDASILASPISSDSCAVVISNDMSSSLRRSQISTQMSLVAASSIKASMVLTSSPLYINTICSYQHKNMPLPSTPSILSPTLLSSLPTPLQPSSLSPTLSSPSSNSLIDLQPLLLPSYSQSSSSSERFPKVPSDRSPNGLKTSNRVNSLITSSFIVSSQKSFTPKAVTSSRTLKTYDFSPSKDSPLKPLKSLRKRPPPPPIGSYKNHVNYFSKLKISNLRRAVLEKSILRKTKNQPSHHACEIADISNPSPVEEHKLRPPFHVSRKFNKTSAITQGARPSLCKSIENSDGAFPTLPIMESSLSKTTESNKSILISEQNKDEGPSTPENVENCSPLNKRKRGRPRKTESMTPNTAVSLPQKKITNTMVTRHSTSRKGEDEDQVDSLKKVVTPDPVICTRSLRKKKQSACLGNDLQRSTEVHETKIPSKCKTTNDDGGKCVLVLQGGFLRSREFLSRYIQTSNNEDILFPHITQEDVCLFKLANRFYNEHKNKSYDVFSQDDGSNDVTCNESLHHNKQDSSLFSREMSLGNSPSQLKPLSSCSEPTRGNVLYELKETTNKEVESKTETNDAQVKRGRGRPKISKCGKELQVVSESERKKKKLISSILRELGDQEDARKMVFNQKTFRVVPDVELERQPTNRVLMSQNNECLREFRSFVTFATPHKRPREEPDVIESTPSKKICVENRPSVFFPFRSDSTSKNNFITFESLISRTAPLCETSLSTSITAEPSLTSTIHSTSGFTHSEERHEKKMEAFEHNNEPTSESCQQEVQLEVQPKCSCMHQCGLENTYLSPPFIRSLSQASNSCPSRVDTWSGVATPSYPPKSLPEPFVYPFNAPSSFLPTDPHKHVLFPSVSSENLRNQQPQSLAFSNENAIGPPGSIATQPFVLLGCHDNLNSMISLVMAPNGYGYYAVPVMDGKMAFPPTNQQGQIVVPCIMNNFAVQSGNSKSSEQEVVPNRPISSLSPPSPIPPSSSNPPSFTEMLQQPEPKSDITAKQSDGAIHKNHSTIHLGEPNGSNNNSDCQSSSSYNSNNVGILSSSYADNESLPGNGYHGNNLLDSINRFGPSLSTNRETPAMYYSTSSNGFNNSSSNLYVFGSSNDGGNRTTRAYFDECTASVRYYNPSCSQYNRHLGSYNHSRPVLPNNVTYTSGLHQRPLQSNIYNDLQFAYSSYANGFTPARFGNQSKPYFVPPENSKCINMFGDNFRNDNHLQRRLRKSEHDPSLWN